MGDVTAVRVKQCLLLRNGPQNSSKESAGSRFQHPWQNDLKMDQTQAQ